MAERGGQPGNANGGTGADTAPFKSALRRAIAQDDSKRIRDAAEKLLDLAAAGEPWAVRELADRTDGKAAQSVTLAGDPDKPLQSKVTVEFVESKPA
jgi:hypothetical protein